MGSCISKGNPNCYPSHSLSQQTQLEVLQPLARKNGRLLKPHLRKNFACQPARKCQSMKIIDWYYHKLLPLQIHGRNCLITIFFIRLRHSILIFKKKTEDLKWSLKNSSIKKHKENIVTFKIINLEQGTKARILNATGLTFYCIYLNWYWSPLWFFKPTNSCRYIPAVKSPINCMLSPLKQPKVVNTNTNFTW